MPKSDWNSIQEMDVRSWICGHCGEKVSSDVGYYKNEKQSGADVAFKPKGENWGNTLSIQDMKKRITICPNCEKPTYFEGNEYFPRPVFGKPIQHLPNNLEQIYNQARDCMSVNAYIPAILTARTILMHIAVEKKAKEGEKFEAYVDYLVDKGFAPPDSKSWIDHIRKQGNWAAHKIELRTREDAEKIIRFIEMLLTFLYEYPKSL